ncbi:MAG: hypothetical protein PHF51_04595 [Candidatus ainarchaeum sp.]|nr:hypothetical protein [Candidatus ainarchaeum sp.]
MVSREKGAGRQAATMRSPAQAAVKQHPGLPWATTVRPHGQAAMEFLITYGWVLMIVLVIISVLLYLNVVGGSIPKTCTFAPGFACHDFAINGSGYLNLDVSQTLGRDINVTGFACSSIVTNPIPSQLDRVVNIPDGWHFAVVGFGSGNNDASYAQCCFALGAGDGCKARMALRYNYADSSVSRTVYGDVIGPLEGVQ